MLNVFFNEDEDSRSRSQYDVVREIDRHTENASIVRNTGCLR